MSDAQPQQLECLFRWLTFYFSVFSAGVSAAATWDKDIMYERGHAMGEEFRGKGAHIYLG